MILYIFFIYVYICFFLIIFIYYLLYFIILLLKLHLIVYAFFKIHLFKQKHNIFSIFINFCFFEKLPFFAIYSPSRYENLILHEILHLLVLFIIKFDDSFFRILFLRSGDPWVFEYVSIYCLYIFNIYICLL